MCCVSSMLRTEVTTSSRGASVDGSEPTSRSTACASALARVRRCSSRFEHLLLRRPGLPLNRPALLPVALEIGRQAGAVPLQQQADRVWAASHDRGVVEEVLKDTVTS